MNTLPSASPPIPVRSVIVHYQEIALKGRNRPWFIERLVANLREATADLDVTAVRRLAGRIELVLGPGATWPTLRDRLRKVFGVANFAWATRTSPEAETLATAIVQDLADRDRTSFAVRVRRADKRYPLTSPELERLLGGRIKSARGWPVNLSAPELTVHVEILPGEAFYFFEKEPGPGGLPVGASGRVMALLSGGIDSPVAAYRMMKRGCRVTFVHFHAYPIVSLASQEKARRLVTLLTEYQWRSRLYLVAFGEIQQRVVLAVPPPLRVVVYRRLMMRIAEQLARRVGAQALVTGEAVGQVASQTLENLAVIEAATTLPVLRPLVGMDKAEIVAEAERLGTFPISIVPDEDCCQLFTPPHPTTRARLRDLEEIERTLPVDEFAASAVERAVREDFRFPVRTEAPVPSP